ncbi:DNA polymerase I [Calothrix sp. NIES-3974]|uniref:DNA polymerase I n=1 Tax=Calothrix sp. NIES-3974 TaxID=2005462 RepID=UPI000B606892|nr:DNA polymerase I [Calothrix sp. NIES-3974]BAZ07285.1 DNA polymerase I [Calothrix sp. NIES-3974]
MRPTFLLIDGHSLAFRSFYAFSKGGNGGLRTKTGIPTSVCFGFLKSLLEVLGNEQPEAVAVAFDLGVPTFRHQADDTYKADRPQTPEDFLIDMENLHELLAALGLRIITKAGYEADDVLGTMAQQAASAGYRVKIVSGDRDLFQLVDADKQISVLYLGKEAFSVRGVGGVTEYGVEEVQGKLGVLPHQIVDYKALCGDKSDNIPGIEGIGEKTAVQLLSTYGSLQNIYDHIGEIKGATHKKLINGKDNAEKSQFLAKIILDVPLDVKLDEFVLRGFAMEALTPVLTKLEFKSFLNKIQQLQQRFTGVNDENSLDNHVAVSPVEDREEQLENQQLSLFPVASADDGLDFWTPAETSAAMKGDDIGDNDLIKVRIIDDQVKLAELIEILRTQTNPEKPVAWDTETSALEPRDAELVGIGCCWGISPDEVAYIPLGHTQGTNLAKNLVLDSLRPILEDETYPKTFQNAKFDRLVLRVQGINLAGVIFDPMLASYVINPDDKHNLNDITSRYLEGINLQNYEDLVSKGKTIGEVSIQQVANYCGLQVYATYQLFAKMQAVLNEYPQLQQLFQQVELPLETVLAEMEFTGVRVDSEYLEKFSRQLEQDLQTIENNAYNAAGETFNLGSPKQLSQLFFEKLGLDVKKSRKTKTGYSTDAAVLEKLQGDHPVIDAIIEHRTLAKLKSTYVDTLPKLIRPDTQRVHTNFNQTATSTGRLSSSNPNLQNIPIRTAFSRQIRQAFLPEPGWLMVAADYSQIELRILAHLSQDPTLITAYQQNQDIHTVTARLVFEKTEITPDERRFAKTINFGVIYGMGAQKFSRETGIKVAEAKKFIAKFNERYADVFSYLEKMKKTALANGFVETILGRRRYFKFQTAQSLLGKNHDEIDLSKLRLNNDDAGLLRAAANAPIQGSSADIIKIAMVQLQQILQGYQARLLLQVHDELVFEIPPQEWEELQGKIKSTMENAVSLSVPLLVEVKAGENWMEAK